MIKVPIHCGFDPTKLIGEVTIDETKLPETVNWCLSLGYLVKDAEFNSEDEIVIKSWELKSFGLILDSVYPGNKS